MIANRGDIGLGLAQQPLGFHHPQVLYVGRQRKTGFFLKDMAQMEARQIKLLFQLLQCNFFREIFVD